MKKHYLALGLIFLTTSCTINFVIETDYASQNGGGGAINEEVTTEAVTTPTVSPDISAEVKPEGL